MACLPQHNLCHVIDMSLTASRAKALAHPEELLGTEMVQTLEYSPERCLVQELMVITWPAPYLPSSACRFASQPHKAILQQANQQMPMIAQSWLVQS